MFHRQTPQTHTHTLAQILTWPDTTSIKRKSQSYTHTLTHIKTKGTPTFRAATECKHTQTHKAPQCYQSDLEANGSVFSEVTLSHSIVDASATLEQD